MLDLEELKYFVEKGSTSGADNREESADDLIFYYLTQWDGDGFSDVHLAYKGVFDIIKPAAQRVLSEMSSNPVQADFIPDDERRTDSAELIDGLYRADCQQNTSIESFEVGNNEQVICGMGAWLMYTDWKSNRSGDKQQVIKRRPIYEANNTVLFDPDSRRMDKSNAKWGCIIQPFTEDGYKTLYKDLTGDEIEDVPGSFTLPEDSGSFVWYNQSANLIYVAEFFHREKTNDKLLTMINPMGMPILVRESDVSDVIDDMMRTGYTVQDEKKIKRWACTKYIASGSDILKTDKLACESIPIIPQYGEYTYVQGEERYEGLTRPAKDAQRLRNFQLSYLFDIVSRSPRQKPIFWPEQIAGYKHMYELSGSDNNYPYLLMNKSYEGGDLPLGPVATMPEQKIPDALIASIGLTREAVEDHASKGLPSGVVDPELSGKAVALLQNQLTKQSYLLQEHRKHALRRDAEIYAEFAGVINDTPRKVKIKLPNGTTKTVKIMESVLDRQTGNMKVINDLRNIEFEVYTKIGPEYNSQKEQTFEQISTMIPNIDPNDPIRKALQLKQLQLMPGVEFDDIREYSNKQLVLMGFKKPETPEEAQMLMQAQMQPKQPDAATLLAMAEMEKGKAEQAKVQMDGVKAKLDAMNEKAKREIDAFRAQTDRMGVQVDAQEAGADINKTNIESYGKQIDNQAKIIELNAPKEKSYDELVQELMEG